MKTILTEKEKQLLFAIYEGFLGKKSDDFTLVEKRLDLMLAALYEEDYRELSFFLKILNQPVFSLLHGENWSEFSEMSLEQREKLLLKLSLSPITAIRKAFLSLKKIAFFAFYAFDEKFRAKVGYEIPKQKNKLTSHQFNFIFAKNTQEFSCDVLIVGSGAGGSVVASELAKKGKKVMIAEKGAYLAEKANAEEGEMMCKLYEKSAALTSKNGEFTIFAGNALGGGTTVNWAGCLPTPDDVREEWAKFTNMPEFLSKDFDNALLYAFEAIGTEMNNIPHSIQNQHLITAADKLNFEKNTIPQNLKLQQNESEYGFIGLGDPFLVKKSTLENLLPEACSFGAEILTHCFIEKIVFKNKKAIYAEAFQEIDGKKTALKIHFDQIVLAAGAIHTPALCMRSGIEHAEIGKNLFLHPTFPIPALYPKKIEIWKGIPMSMSVDAFVHFDKNYGFKIETPPVHLGTMAVALPWKNAKTHQNLMEKAANIGAFFALLRDRQGGNIRLSKAGKPIIDYKMQPQDWETALVAMENLLLMHENAGALETYLVHTDCQTFEHGKGLNIKEFVRKQRWQSNRFTIFSAHQMGTVRMGADKKRFPLSPNGNFYDYPNVYVADASVFPSASGANPMITVLALAYLISKRM